MRILSIYSRRKLRDYVVMILIGVAFKLIFKWDFLEAVGGALLVYIAVDLLMWIFGALSARFMFTKVTPSSVKELKHSSKKYQYICTVKGKELYSDFYKQPLENVNVICYQYMGSYFADVKRK